MKEKDLTYLRCPNCGKYFSNIQEKENKFCSEECRIYYKSCTACGNYFISSRTENKIFCSTECGISPELKVPSLEQELSLLHQPQTLSVESL